MSERAPFPLGLGCAAVACLGLCLSLGVVGLFLLWAAYDEQVMSREFREEGQFVSVTVTGKEQVTSARHTSRGAGGGATQYWLTVEPGEGGPAGRLPVSRDEHDAALAGDRMTVWKLGQTYQLERVVDDPLSYTVAWIFLGVGGASAIAVVAIAVAIRRRIGA